MLREGTAATSGDFDVFFASQGPTLPAANPKRACIAYPENTPCTGMTYITRGGVHHLSLFFPNQAIYRHLVISLPFHLCWETAVFLFNSW